MIQRFVYTAQLNPLSEEERHAFRQGLEACSRDDSILSVSVMQWKDRLFFYYECRDGEALPEELFPDILPFLALWPGEAAPRHFVRMYDIFHYNAPVTDEDWIRSRPMQPYAQMMRIYPDKLGSYIFYHQQLQEEHPGSGNKYGIICMHENLLFFYLENPEITTDTLVFQGKLSTDNTPKDWGAAMQPHFMPWEDLDNQILWRRDVELLYHFEVNR